MTSELGSDLGPERVETVVSGAVWGGLAVPRVLGGTGGADLGLAWIVGLDVGRAVADEPIGDAQGHSELEPLAGLSAWMACSSCRNWRAWLGRLGASQFW
jgi:hypothetical protein